MMDIIIFGYIATLVTVGAFVIYATLRTPTVNNDDRSNKIIKRYKEVEDRNSRLKNILWRVLTETQVLKDNPDLADEIMKAVKESTS
jgi:hypothetical protein